MNHFYVLGDSRYLPHMCVLLDSMKENFINEYHVHLLALDEKVEKFLKTHFDKKTLTVYTKSQIDEDFEVRSIRYLPPSREAISNASASNKDPGFVQYCWSLSSCFGHWLMERLNVPLTYVDADIMFFSDINDFFVEINDKSIGLVRHRIPYLYTSGEFNVGLVYFKNDGPGKLALRAWRNMMMNPQSNYSLGFGACGDQKYLEILNLIFRKDTKIVDENFGHLAPWNVTYHNFIDNKIIWNDTTQILSYYHFAHFNITEDSYSAAYGNEWIWGDPLKTHEFVNKLYDLYYHKITRYMEIISK